jgi:hypothetical protein
MIAEATKRCKDCGETFPLSAFYKNASKKDGAQTYCKTCNCVRGRMSEYGLSRDEVLNFLAVPCCQSCGVKFEFDSDIMLDHCHDIGHVRGAICHACNMACRGGGATSIARLLGCADYLARDIEREQTRTH